MAEFRHRSLEKPTSVRWAIFTLAWGTSWLLYLHRYIFALIKPKLAEEWGVSTSELGLYDSVFSLFYTGFQFPLGILADAIGVHVVLSTLIVVWSTGLAMQAWAPEPGYLWYARALLGIGQSAAFANINRISRIWFPQSVRSTLQGLTGVLAGRVGGLSANLLFGFFMVGVLVMDWRNAVYVLALLGLCHALLFGLLFRNAPRNHPGVNEAERELIEGSEAEKPKASAPKISVREMMSRTSLRGFLNLICLNVQTILSTFADNIYSNWIPLFLFQVHALKFKEMGIYSALPLLGGALGGFIGGYLNDLLIAGTGNARWARTGVAGIGKGMAAVMIFTALLWYDNPYIFCIFLFVVKLFGDWSLSTSWGVVTDIGGKATATVFAFNNSVAGIGSIVGPIIYGVLAQHFGWRIVFLTAGCAYVLCALSWLLIDCTIPIIRESAQDK